MRIWTPLSALWMCQLLRQPSSKRHIEDFDLLRGNWHEVALADEILCKSVIGHANGKHLCVLVGLPGLAALGSAHTPPWPCGTPPKPRASGHKRPRGSISLQSRCGYAVLLCPHQMILEGSIRQPCAISAVTVNNERSRADSCSSQLQTPPNKTSSLGSATFGAGSPGPSLTAACFFMARIPSSQVFLRDLFVFVASGFPASSGMG